MSLAYLDPASGSLIASALVGGVAAAGVAAKQARSKIVGFGRKRKQEPEFTPDQADAPDAEAPEAEADTVADADAEDTTPVASDT